MEKKQFFSVWSYFLFTFIFTWTFWITAVLIDRNFSETITLVLFILGGIGPILISITLTLLNKDEDKKDFWDRIYNVRRISWKWFLVIIFLPLIIILTAMLISYLSKLDLNPFSGFMEFFGTPYLILSTVGLNLGAAILEEVGWRGFALKKLQLKYNALVSSCILGCIWAVWHIPLFFIEGSYQNQLGVNTLEFWFYLVEIIAISIIITWLFNNTKESILGAIIFHFLNNVVGEVFSPSEYTAIIRFALFWGVALIIVVVFKPKKFIITKKKSQDIIEKE